MPDPQTPRFRFDDRPEWCSMCGGRLPHPERAKIYPCACPSCAPESWPAGTIAAWWTPF